MNGKEENSAFTTADSEELDYEGDDVPAKKFSPVTFEIEDDMEEGEISDANESLKCHFYQQGECYAGDKCRFLHVTDQGLYRMFDTPHGSEFMNPPPSSEYLGHSDCGMPEEPAVSAWDRALVEAKRLIREKESRVNRACNPVLITIESDNEPVSRPKPRRYKSPEALPRKAGGLSDSPKCKSVKNRHDWRRENKWHDPWRRSPVSCSKSNAVSSKFRRRKSSTNSSRSERRVRYKKRNYSRNRTTESRYKRISSSSSCSPVSVGRSRKEKYKRDLKVQEKKFASSVHKKLDKRPKVLERVKEKPPYKTYISFASDKSKNPTKLPCARVEKKTPPSFDNKPLKPTELVKKKPPSFNSHQSNDACKRTSKKVLPSEKKKIHCHPTPVQSCSDMSISPLSDSSLSDLFDPDKKTDRALRAGWHRPFPVQKTCQKKVRGSIVLPENKVVSLFKKETLVLQNDGLETTMNSVKGKPKETTSNCVAVNKVDLPKPKAMKKRNLHRLEGDLLKFQPGYRSRPTAPKTVQSKNTVQSNPKKSAKSVENRMLIKDSLPQSQKVKENKKDLGLESTIIALTRKEVLLKQLDAINAAIERKKKQCGDTQ